MDKWMNMNNNNFNKILALLFAVILWTMVHIDNTMPASQSAARVESKIIENVPIQVSGLDEDKYVMDPLETTSVRLQVQGKNNDINFVMSDAYKVTLDLSEVQPGVNTIPLHYRLPRGVSLIAMTPDVVTVRIELRNTKTFPVTVRTEGAQAEGYLLGTPVIQPEGGAKVTLPTSDLSRVAKVGGTVELDGEKTTVSVKKMKLYAYDANGNELKDALIEPATVSVVIPITLPYKTVPLEFSYTGQLADSLVLSSVTPEMDNVVVYGSEAALASVNACEAVIDLGAIRQSGETTLTLKPRLPEGTERVEPDTVQVAISVSQSAQRTISDIPVTLQGVAAGMKAAVTAPEDQKVSLELTGASSLLQQLSASSIKAVADVSGLAAGKHVVPVQVSLPRFVSLSQPEQRLTVTVALSEKPASGGLPSASPEASATPEPPAEPASGTEPTAPAPTVSPDGKPSGAVPSPSSTSEEEAGDGPDRTTVGEAPEMVRP
ncbi:hypothetical protein F4V43_19475 [Paenibacillus spiritus]|uniref:YbbR-like domain-containing protein n=1 Tax=Paenibacillus spiritus TaxID=2496557 RepID=A0A5J5FQN3_9BACL|nr:CdaR family protein [Paenibacillus spiritus]KAA8995292.1 hypothetical protein F4V43_19475 [Paenibacillus spiritus]